MLAAKQVADLLTLARLALVVPFIWVGINLGEKGLPTAVWLLLVSWLSDTLDGPIARRSGADKQTWLGDHDLQADMLVSLGALIYLCLAGFLNSWLGAGYVLVWSLVFWFRGIERPLGMLFQAPIYGFFLYTAWRYAPVQGMWLVGWLLFLVVITWPRFPKEVVPDFLDGMHAILWKGRH